MRKAKKRLIVGFGAANVVNVSAVLETHNKKATENYYAYFGRPSETKKVKKLIDKILPVKEFYDFSSELGGCDISRDRIMSKIEIRHFDEIFLQFNGTDYREITRLFPFAKYFLVEDGLSSYLKHNINYLMTKKPKALFSYNYLNKFEPHICVYDGVKNLEISKAALKNVYEICAADISEEDCSNSVVIAAQELYSSNIMSYEQELKMYRDAIDVCLSKGYKVLFKEHPRARFPFFDELKHIYPETQVSELEALGVPVEVFCWKNKPKALISVFSTSLFLASEVLGIQVFTLDMSKYKQVKAPLNRYDYADFVANVLFDNIELLSRECEVQRQTLDIALLIKLKELELYRYFLSKKEFYMLKEKICAMTDEEFFALKKYGFSQEFLTAFREEFYFDLIRANLPVYVVQIREYIDMLKRCKSLFEAIKLAGYGLKTMLRISS